MRYRSLHAANSRNWTRPESCEFCGDRESPVYDWALLRGREHSWAREDYINLCRKCHNQYDDVGRRAAATRRANADKEAKKHADEQIG